VTPLEQLAVTTAVHMVAGAVSGGINSAITGSNLGMGMLTGAVGAGIGAGAGGILPDKFGYQLVGRIASGAGAGGVVSGIYGGNFWEGFAQGATTAAAAFLFNQWLHSQGGNNDSEINNGDQNKIAEQQAKIKQVVGDLKKVAEAIPEYTGDFLQLIGYGVKTAVGPISAAFSSLVTGLKVVVTGAEQVQKPTMLNENKLNKAAGIQE
jgi:hypothetical protein